MSESQEAEVEVFKDTHLWELLGAVQLMITIDFCIEMKGSQIIVGVYNWICVLDYLNKTQVSRSFGAKPPCQDLMKNTKMQT